jgi:hypothetical protein
MLIILFSSSSFIGKKSDKLRTIFLRNGFNLSEILSKSSVFKYIIEKYCYNSVFFISNIVSEDKKKCLSYQEFQNKEEFEDTQGVINNTYVLAKSLTN